MPEFLYLQLKGMYQIIRNLTGDKERSGLSMPVIRGIKIGIPSIKEQQTIVKSIEEEMQLVKSNKRLVEIFEQKIKTKIGEVWGVKEEVETV